MSRRDEQVLDVVVVLEIHPHHADPAPALLPVRRHRQPLDVAGARDGDDHVLFGDQIFELELFLRRHDLGSPVVALRVDPLDLEQLLTDKRIDLRLVREDRAQLCDALLEICELVLDALALEPGEPGEAQVEDGLSLDLAQVELLHEALPCLVGVVGGTDQSDDGIEVVERDEIALEDVSALLGLAKLVLRPAGHHLTLVIEVVGHQLEQRQRSRDTADERDRVVAERRLQRGVLEQLVEHDLRNRLALQLDLDPHSGPVGVVGKVGDLGQDLVLDEVGDLLDDACVAALLHAVGKLGHDDRRAAAAELLDVSSRPHDDPAPPRSMGVPDAAPADDDRAGRKVGPLDVA